MPTQRSLSYHSKLTRIQWTCCDCAKGGNTSGHYPAQSHAKATGHRVLVTQTVQYLYHYPSGRVPPQG